MQALKQVTAASALHLVIISATTCTCLRQAQLRRVLIHQTFAALSLCLACLGGTPTASVQDTATDRLHLSRNQVNTWHRDHLKTYEATAIKRMHLYLCRQERRHVHMLSLYC
eukprot:TRINITY_DN2065_c0_g1_i1.p1 TRINITY_DN2065_c0_g1~~TRINITY_DN2065_c0_g1_i1.p1  ORF type:complete len:112 (-),score=0.76 TRINITY_DN2065_c0_g1_i1:330-665(-)